MPRASLALLAALATVALAGHAQVPAWQILKPTNTGLYGAYVNALALTPGPWANLGNALPGTQGLPFLVGLGSLAGGTTVTLGLDRARPQSQGAHILGAGSVSFPIFGGVLVPRPDMALPFTSDAAGKAGLAFPWPAGMPSGTAAYLQSWVLDPAAVQGFAATNALRATQR